MTKQKRKFQMNTSILLGGASLPEKHYKRRKETHLRPVINSHPQVRPAK